jgi:hypothetical protein
MPTGRKICDILKDIRKTVSESEGIDLHQSECHHKGECLGTCPKCEAELQEINNKVSHNRLLTIGTATLTAVSLSACGINTNTSDISGDVSVSTESKTAGSAIGFDTSTAATTESSEIYESESVSELESTETSETTETFTETYESEIITSELDTETLDYYELSGDISPSEQTTVYPEEDTNSSISPQEEKSSVYIDPNAGVVLGFE